MYPDYLSLARAAWSLCLASWRLKPLRQADDSFLPGLFATRKVRKITKVIGKDSSQAAEPTLSEGGSGLEGLGWFSLDKGEIEMGC